MRNLLILAAVGIAAYFIWQRFRKPRDMTNFEKIIHAQTKQGLREKLVKETGKFNASANVREIRANMQNTSLVQGANSEQGYEYNGIDEGNYHVSLNYLS